jgi:two-component system, OmpR family, phosphate regulon sensor histidine kinase PhoR
MRNSTIRFLFALATLSILGIVITQVYWVRQAFDLKEQQFNQSVNIALQNVAKKIAELNQIELTSKLIAQPSSNYYVVNVNTSIDAEVLEHYLKAEFAKHQLEIDYEYAVFDCSSNEMIYGNYIRANQEEVQKAEKTHFPKTNEFTYYFGIRFPSKSLYLANQLDIWIFSSFILLTVIVFFGYTMFVIFKQRRLSEIQRDFINNMTHEFKTPISTIAVSADLITNPKILAKPDSIVNYANIIKTQNTRLRNQIEKVLQMAVMDKGIELKKEIIDVHQLVQEAVASFNLKEQAEIKVELQAAEQCKCVLADKVHLTNIIYNLLDNAVKYVDKEPKIIVATRQVKNQIALSIQDNGIGIGKEHQRKVFEKFFRVPTGNRHDVKGFGLGLNYVKQIVKAHQWKINLQSELGKGSTFTITMPIAPIKTSEAASKADLLIAN